MTEFEYKQEKNTMITDHKEKENNKPDPHRLLTIFTSMFTISAFTFGGGFVISTFMKKKFVDQLHWIDEDTMLDLIALAQASPGAIAVNVAILVGWNAAGFAGMLTAVFATILPPMLILTVVSWFYNAFASNPVIALFLKGMQAGVAAILLDVVLDLGIKVVKQKKWISDLLMVLVFALVFFLNVNVIYIILAAIVLGLLATFVQKNKMRKPQ